MSQKPYTTYECASGSTGLGHSSVYTGASPSNRTDLCACGEPLVEVVPDGFRYKVVFESISPFQAAEMVSRYGKGVWRTLTDAQWEALEWTRPITSDSSTPNVLRDQYRTLVAWAESHEQPIRNVHFFKAQEQEASWKELSESEAK